MSNFLKNPITIYFMKWYIIASILFILLSKLSTIKLPWIVIFLVIASPFSWYFAKTIWPIIFHRNLGLTKYHRDRQTAKGYIKHGNDYLLGEKVVKDTNNVGLIILELIMFYFFDAFLFTFGIILAPFGAYFVIRDYKNTL